MMTTLPAMKCLSVFALGAWARRALIILTALALAGCGAVRLAYQGAPQFTWWWLDGQFDFTSEQETQVKAAIDKWFAWHRVQQLPDYVRFLSVVDQRTQQAVDSAQMCAFYDDARSRLQPALDQALELAADIVPLLGPAQVRAFEKSLAKTTADMRKDFLQGDLDERRSKQLDRTITRYERLYGRLTEGQRRLVAQQLQGSPFDAQAWLADRERRQRDMLTQLRRWVAERPDRATLLAGLKALAERSETSTDTSYRAQQQRMREFTCRTAAELHNTTQAEQREALRRQLRTWSGDLRALAT
jgi:hypothetical protein